MMDFLRKHIKLMVALILVIVVIVTVIIVNGKKYQLEEYIKPEYHYFAMYSTNGKVGVVD